MDEAVSDQTIPPSEDVSYKSQKTISSSLGIKKYAIFTILGIVILVSVGVLVQLLFQSVSPKPPVTEPLITPFEDVPLPTTTTVPTSSTTQVPQPKEVMQLSFAHTLFGFNILKQLQTEDKNKNIFLSPASIALALSMTYNGASGETKTAMARTLQIEEMSIDEVNKASANLIALLKSPDQKVQILVANSIWGRQGEEFNPEFLATNEKFYRAKIASLDFNLPTAADTINGWVNENTRGKIPTIIQPPIPPEMVMYLINAIYFKGTWTVEFDKKLTNNKEFTSANGTKGMRPMMQQARKDFNYLETDDFQTVELPYGQSKRLGMYIFLPKSDLTAFSTKLTGENWNIWMNNFQEKEGILVMPKFKIEYGKKLNSTLKKLGMEVAFIGGKADFTKIAPDLFISEVIHKSYIEVNEEGTEAAAVTEVGIAKTAMPKDERFYMEVNKPFFFAIRDKQTGEVLFMGTVQEIPQN